VRAREREGKKARRRAPTTESKRCERER
jgi:hypothetical protein